MVGKVFCKVLNNRKHLDKGKALHEGQANFSVEMGCVNIYALNELVQGRLQEGKETCILSRCAEGIRTIVCGVMTCCEVVGIWGQREDVEGHKRDVRIFKECCWMGNGQRQLIWSRG